MRAGRPTRRRRDDRVSGRHRPRPHRWRRSGSRPDTTRRLGDWSRRGYRSCGAADIGSDCVRRILRVSIELFVGAGSADDCRVVGDIRLIGTGVLLKRWVAVANAIIDTLESLQKGLTGRFAGYSSFPPRSLNSANEPASPSVEATQVSESYLPRNERGPTAGPTSKELAFPRRVPYAGDKTRFETDSDRV